MAKGEVFTAKVQQIAAGGAGLTRQEGKSVFIPLTAPGDVVRCRVVNERGTWAEAELVELLERSPQRVDPECPLYGICGGCSLQHLSYKAQLDAKAAILRDAFVRIGGFQPPAAQVRECAPFGCRNRVQFHSGRGERGEFVQCGFMGRRSSRLVPLDDCPAADMGIRAALKEGTISGDGRERFTVYSCGKTFLCEGGQERGRVSLVGRDLAMDATVFFQSNAAMLELLIADV
ncbi:MAG: class I SAM-dependent RNA methyltransferase, partial [Treponema sp.]|nr:class I SAM-dependent RNA methyltransferase [Treponema sp.]